jgi:hypothetical protein
MKVNPKILKSGLKTTIVLVLSGLVVYAFWHAPLWQQLAMGSIVTITVLLREPRLVAALLNVVSWAARQLMRIRYGLFFTGAAAATAICLWRSLRPDGREVDAVVAVVGLNILVVVSTTYMNGWRRKRLYTAVLGVVPAALFVSVLIARSPQVDTYNEGRRVFDSGRGDPAAATKLFEQSSKEYNAMKARPPLLKFLYGGESQVVECRNRYECGLALIAQRKPDKAVECYLEGLTVLPCNSPVALREAPGLPIDVIRALEKLWLKGGGGGGRGQQPGPMQKPQMRPQFGEPQPHDDF